MSRYLPLWLSDFAFVLGYNSTASDIENQTVLSLKQKEGTQPAEINVLEETKMVSTFSVLAAFLA